MTWDELVREARSHGFTGMMTDPMAHLILALHDEISKRDMIIVDLSRKVDMLMIPHINDKSLYDMIIPLRLGDQVT